MTTASLAAHRQPVQNRWQPARRGFTVWRRKTGLAVKRVTARAVGYRRATLTLTAFGLIDDAAFQIGYGHAGTGIGLLVTGISVLIFEWLVSGD
jgi:hypothetical protein